jgi:hypothetical protein
MRKIHCCSVDYTPILFVIAFIVFSLPLTINAQETDNRAIENGSSIYENSYIDQPYVSTLKDGRWFCVFTTGPMSESGPGQHIVSMLSANQGKSWSTPVNIEPDTGAISSWGIPYVTDYGRIYVFYNYNGDHVSMVNDRPIKQAGLLGWYCYKYSDDNGKTWSRRFRLPIKKTAVDLNNEWHGDVQMFWGIDKPHLVRNKLFFAFTRLGKFPQSLGEGWFFSSDNIPFEKDPSKIKWTLMPFKDKGLANTSFGSVQEEFNTVTLSNNSIYCIYRTTMGFPAQSTSNNGGESWTTPQIAAYTPQGQPFKNPRACPRLFKCKNGKYLFWYHNHSGKDFKGRNPVWLSGGIEKGGTIFWSQPEILLYGDSSINGMSYPDLIEKNGKYWITETQKSKARVHVIDPDLLNGLWNQATSNKVVKQGILINKAAAKRTTISNYRIPSLIDGGFAVELWATFPDFTPGQILLDNRNENGKGFYIRTIEGNRLQMQLDDGKNAFTWETDPELLQINHLHHIVFNVDGRANILSIIVDGRLCDGGNFRQYGWGRFSNKLGDVNAKEVKLAPDFKGAIDRVRIYNRYLTTSEAISNFHAGPKA